MKKSNGRHVDVFLFLQPSGVVVVGLAADDREDVLSDRRFLLTLQHSLSPSSLVAV